MGIGVEKAISNIVTFYYYENKKAPRYDLLDDILVFMYELFDNAIKIMEPVDFPKRGSKRVIMHHLREALMMLSGAITTTGTVNKIVALDTGIHYAHRAHIVDAYYPDFKKFRVEVRKRHWIAELKKDKGK